MPVTRAVEVEEEDTATILYTSGTTGRPKGAMLTYFSTIHSVIHYAWVMELTEEDRTIIAVPMSHVTGVIALIDTMVYCAGALVIMPAFKAADFIDLAARHRTTFTVIVPAMFNLCLLAPNFEGADLSAWRVSGYGGAIMPEVTVERIAQKLPRLKLVNCYGSTETTSPGRVHAAGGSDRSEGIRRADGSVRTHHRHGRGGARGSLRRAGEVIIGGAMVVPGYFNNPEATEREFKAGYWKSGDLGIMDEKGYLRIIDRIKDVINRGGYKIFASEVENTLLDHPAVIEAAVVAKPCPVLGERVHAFVVLRHPVDDQELPTTAPTCCLTTRCPRPFIGSSPRCRATPTARCSSAICASTWRSPETQNRQQPETGGINAHGRKGAFEPTRRQANERASGGIAEELGPLGPRRSTRSAQFPDERRNPARCAGDPARQGLHLRGAHRKPDRRSDLSRPTQPQRSNTQDFGDYQSGKRNPLPGGIQYADDQITMFLQGSTQYDALGHVWYDDRLWNGYPASETIGGMNKASILPIAERGVVGRGVLLDMAAHRGKFALEKGDTVNLDDLLAAAKKQGVTIEKHDILCLRIGFLQLLRTQGPESFLRQLQRTGSDLQPRARGLVP